MKSEQCQDLKSDLKCAYCDKQFKYESERRRHEQSHTPQFECKVCMKKFSFISALRRHEKQHERKGSVICSECNRKFRDETLLKRHIKYAHKGTFICSKCNATFNSDLALRAHTKTHKPESERRFRCSIQGCNKSFNFAHHLKHHEMTHTDTKQHFCKICGKGFIQFHHLKTHLKSHDPEDWLQCTNINCNKKFTTEYALKRHLSTHKMKTDSGISSDSSSTYDVPKLEAKGLKSKVSTLDRPITRQDNEKHIDTLEINQESNLAHHINTEDISLGPIKFEIEDIGKHLPVKPNSRDYPREEDNFEDSFRSCKTVLGGCIMSRTGETNRNCLCAQISCNSTTEDCDLTQTNDYIKISDTINTADNTKTKGNETNTRNINICVGCECGSNINTDKVPTQMANTKCTKAMSYVANDDVTMPELDYRTDGTIKIKDIYYFDIEAKSGIKADDFDKVLFPFNSCKSILGKCIVSGNGTIGEGCLCAKMSLEENSGSAAEIEEITPRPM